MREKLTSRFFQVGSHVVQVFGRGRRWMVAVDGVRLQGWRVSAAAAWEAGVRKVDPVRETGGPQGAEAAAP